MTKKTTGAQLRAAVLANTKPNAEVSVEYGEKSLCFHVKQHASLHNVSECTYAIVQMAMPGGVCDVSFFDFAAALQLAAYFTDLPLDDAVTKKQEEDDKTSQVEMLFAFFDRCNILELILDNCVVARKIYNNAKHLFDKKLDAQCAAEAARQSTNSLVDALNSIVENNEEPKEK